MSNSDPFLHQRILELTDTPMQRKLRKMAPMPVGAVFLPWPGMTEDEAREQLRTMKELGFTCLKQTMGSKEWPTERIYRVALDEGINPFWYAEGGWEEITPELLTKLGLDPEMDIDEAMDHPKMQEYQKEVINQQIEDDLAARQAKQAQQEVKLDDADKNKTLGRNSWLVSTSPPVWSVRQRVTKSILPCIYNLLPGSKISMKQLKD